MGLEEGKLIKQFSGYRLKRERFYNNFLSFFFMSELAFGCSYLEAGYFSFQSGFFTFFELKTFVTKNLYIETFFWVKAFQITL